MLANKQANWFRFLCGLFVLALISGCAGRGVRPDAPPGTEDPRTEDSRSEQRGGHPAEDIRVALVLGGAGVASFATVGLLKRFEQEGVRVERIVASGWPALFALGYGFMGSVHDLEWFAMQLKPDDLLDNGLFGFSRDFSDMDALDDVVTRRFSQKRDLREARVPVILTASSLVRGSVEAFDRGDWKPPLFRAMAVPGIYRPFPPDGSQQWIASMEGLDVAVAAKGRVNRIIAVDMYEDYLRYQTQQKLDSSGNLFRRIFLTEFRDNLRENRKKTPLKAEIFLNRAPNDFRAKRQAILSGYQEATRLIEELRRRTSE